MLILFFNQKKNIVINILFLTLFIGNIDASIYGVKESKNIYVLDPVKFQYQYGNFSDGVGGADNFLEKNIVRPKKNLNLIEADKKNIKEIPLKDRISIYIVRKGDNLSKIAKKFNISQNTIIWENNLNSKKVLKVGQKLRILPINGIRYKVEKGDSLSKIAQKTKSKIIDIQKVNKIKNGKLKIGQILFIPNGQKSISKKNIKSKRKGVVVKRSYKTKTENIKVSKSPLSKLFIKPTIAKFTSPFGWRWGRMHKGVDFAAARGTAIVSAASGVVVKTVSTCRVGNRHCGGGYGNYVLIQHDNGYQTRYAHLLSVQVLPGQRVKQGVVVGKMGNTGRVFPRPKNRRSTAGTHLHFEIIKNGRHISPNFMKYK